jgi:hypothetical protein
MTAKRRLEGRGTVKRRPEERGTVFWNLGGRRQRVARQKKTDPVPEADERLQNGQETNVLRWPEPMPPQVRGLRKFGAGPEPRDVKLSSGKM